MHRRLLELLVAVCNLYMKEMRREGDFFFGILSACVSVAQTRCGK